VVLAGLVAAVAGTVLAVAVIVATGGTARWFPTMDGYPLWWTSGATAGVAAAGVLVWRVQAWYERRSAGLVPAVQRPEPRVGSSEFGASKPVYGRPVRRWDPLALGVHRVIGGGPLPPYIRRPHDELLLAALDPAVDDSRLVVVRGGSSTGKTRAAYEAVARRLADWHLDYPLDTAALAARLQDGIPPRTVLWLGELRQYVEDDGGLRVLARLADLLDGKSHLIITTVWAQHWDGYIAAARAGPDSPSPAGTAGRLLARLPELTGIDPTRIDPARGGVVDVPELFTVAELQEVSRTHHPVLVQAAASAARAEQDGQVTQYLAGVPDLLRRCAGPGGDPYGQAVITAAMDATRLGHAAPLPAALLQEAAVGYLTSPQRTQDIAIWSETAISWAAEELQGAVRALRPIPPVTGTGVAGYQIADYLNQHGRKTRQDQIGPDSLWDALTVHASSPGDFNRLGQAARDRGLFRYAATLWTKAAVMGGTDAACRLIAHLDQISSSDAVRAGRWAAAWANIDDSRIVVCLLNELDEVGLSDAASVLSARAAARDRIDGPAEIGNLLMTLHVAGFSHAFATIAARAAQGVRLDEPAEVAFLVDVMGQSQADEAISVLGSRIAGEVSLGDPQEVGELLKALHEAGAADAVTALAAIAAEQVNADEPRADARLLKTLHQAEAFNAVRSFADRAAAHADLTYAHRVAELLDALRQVGASDAIPALSARLARAPLGDLQRITGLLEALHEAGATDAVTEIAARAATQTRLDSAGAVAWLLNALQAASAIEAIWTLLGRGAAEHVSLDEPAGVARLLRELLSARASGPIQTLLGRNPAEHVNLDSPDEVVELLMALREAQANEAVDTLAQRVAEKVSRDKSAAVNWLSKALGRAGSIGLFRSIMRRTTFPVSIDRQNMTWVMEVLSNPITGQAVRKVAAEASLDDPAATAGLLRQLRYIEAGEIIRTLADRAVDQVSLDNLRAVSELLTEMTASQAHGAVIALAARAAAQADLARPRDIATLMNALQAAQASDALQTLLDRDPAAHANLIDPSSVALLARALHKSGASGAITTLAEWAVAHTSLHDPRAAAFLLTTMHQAGAADAVTALAARAATQADLDDHDYTERLLKEMVPAHADEAARTLTERAANAGMFDILLTANPALAPQYKFGRTPDGAPDQPWIWQEP